MVKGIVGVIAALALCAGSALAQTAITKGPIKPVPATDAAGMFKNYCATCHGTDGTGHGPAALALTKAPADLTRISARNNGVFPDIRVRRYIEGVDEVAAHGTRDMPIWGPLFRSLSRDTAQLRIAALADYLKSLQQ